ncbi:BnaC07g49610D [Brassica napus]|uniref:BnaC07g49610D protein n=1 Tax=Brassica napus TaxID=3708 RepID=A0A078JYR1_BRANA|nr:BnaC07g49610D [Brassica napus]
MLHTGDEYLISTLIPFEPAQISFDPRECLHLLLILLNQPSFDDLVGLSASGIGVTVNLWRGSILTWQENFMISYQSECFFDGLLTLMVITLAFVLS